MLRTAVLSVRHLMTTKAIAKLGALGIGALIVVQALNSTFSSLSTLEEQSEVTLWALSIPILVSLCFAVFLYRYASRLELEAGPSSTRSLMWVGVKLLGIYLIVIGLPGALAGLGLLAFNSMVGESSSNAIAAVYAAISGSVQILLGLILLLGTKKLVEMSGADDA